MNKEKMSDKIETVGSNPQAYQRVKTTPGAVAYVGLGFVKEGVKAIKVDGVMPTERTIASGTYPVARPLFMFTDGYPKLGSLIHSFVTFHLSEKGHDIVLSKGFVPVTEY
jgi:phosphate transport system substrate-binding protein